jgi:GT2 family glycosyltransferase
VNFRSYADLRSCLASLLAQRHPPRATLVVDHDPDPRAAARLRDEFPGVGWAPQRNRGFGAGANRFLDWTAREHPGVPFALLLNPDVQLAPDYAAALLRALQRAPRIALGSGKLLRPDGRTLDTAGIAMSRLRRSWDRGAGRLDRRQYDRCETVFAVSGAALMLRREALRDLSVEGEVFDEDFFAYREETDLAWRAGLLGWGALYVPEARAQHRRRWRPETRRRVEAAVRRHSFKNHYLQLVKNERAADFVRDLPFILGFELLRLAHVLLRDPALLPGYADALRLLPRALAKRRVIQRRAGALRAGTGVERRGPE